MASQIIFETHSTSTDNEYRIASGWSDCSLSDLGRREATELGERRGGEPSVIYTSDLKRARQTAEIAFGDSGVPIKLDGRLRECNYGALNGAPIEQVEAQRLERLDEPFPEGESYREVAARVMTFLDDLPKTARNASILIIGHRATKYALDCLLAGQDLADVVSRPFLWQEGWVYTESRLGHPG